MPSISLYYIETTPKHFVKTCTEPSKTCPHTHYFYLSSAARDIAAALPERQYHIADNGEIELCDNFVKCTREKHFTSRAEVVRHHRETYDFSGKWRPLQNPFISLLELELVDFVDRLGCRTVLNSKNVIAPYELDIYLSDIEIALEFNGDFWHSDKQIQRRYGIDAETYHYKKVQRCQEIGVKLGFVWEANWRQDWLTLIDVICDLIQFRSMHPLLYQLSNPASPTAVFWEKTDRDTMDKQRRKIEARRRKKMKIS